MKNYVKLRHVYISLNKFDMNTKKTERGGSDVDTVANSVMFFWSELRVFGKL